MTDTWHARTADGAPARIVLELDGDTATVTVRGPVDTPVPQTVALDAPVPPGARFPDLPEADKDRVAAALDHAKAAAGLRLPGEH